ncbi:hypothetical protein L6250_01795 [Candidatus Parcubacteria bacterium]|nr:hypothetical protein [Patescibacteria group bacterium]MBU4466545.1 hypothetical protein [Patescibacteria group bacterium]MCG2688348.1 hypothetical protein [Candidatus Parcubacteria bacterium]
MSKSKEKEKAIALRKRGYSYSEILKEVPVYKSTLSIWLRSVGLAKKQKQRLTEKRLKAALRGSLSRKTKRLVVTEEIKKQARKEIGNISDRELWLVGIALYWGEGSKQKENNPSQPARFTNSDPLMIKLYLKWLQKICKIARKDILFEIYLHETTDIESSKKYWSKVLGFSLNQFQKIRIKKNKIRTKRKNIGSNYYGLIRVEIRKSTNFNRKINGWIEGIYQHCGIV